ncbi:hypothetical protein [Thermosipho sp. 1074]|uniref:hypothetical protein n=1 Tax=Thermosipho sp. 1074 TaxID=1643331 RepID=UPI0009853442|nr:hypothetical protein [Thermosipho sp. 1074]OOC42044.1 hypothetical protein XO08_07050 [Thermosipho sp. 1074]
MISGLVLLSIGVLLLFSIFFSFSFSLIFYFGLFIGVFGFYRIIKEFPKGVAAIILGIIIILHGLSYIKLTFFDFILVLVSAGLIEVGLGYIVKKR